MKKFEKDEQKRIDEAKRNGSIVEELKNSGSSEGSNGIHAPLLENDRYPQPEQLNQQQIVQNNNQNIGQARTIIPGLITRQANGTFRIC